MYFFIDSKIKLEDNARQIEEKGELAYCPQVNAVAIGYGPTPISKGNEIKLTSDYNIWGITNYNLEKLNYSENNKKILMIK